MKITILSDGYPPNHAGGAEIIASHYAQSLALRGHAVTVLTVVHSKHETAECVQGMVRIVSVYIPEYHSRWRDWIGAVNPLGIVAVWRQLLRLRPDIIYAHNVHRSFSWAALFVCRLHSKALIFQAHDAMAVYPGKVPSQLSRVQIGLFTRARVLRYRFNPFYTWIARMALRRAYRVLVVSDALADFLRANSICDVQTLHNGIDPAWASIKQEAVDEFRARYQLNDKRVILQAGRLTGEKGIDCMAELISALGHRRETIRILLVGDITPDAQRILTWSEREGRADLVVATGRLSQDEIKAAYACADVVVVLSRYMDPFPTTNLEAMAFRRPIIGTKYGGTPEAVTNGVSGYIVDPFNAAEYTTKAIRLIDDESLGNRLGEAGRNRLERDFTLKNQTETLLKIFDSVITR